MAAVHEVGIARTILEMAERELADRGVSDEVERIVFSAGRLNAVIPEILVFNFDVLKRDFPRFAGALLEVEETPIRARCRACAKGFEIDEPLFVCPDCGSPAAVESGREMILQRIVIRDPSKAG
jgi:hydrogenase nickel incorporation protein HypA/HybF